MTRAEVATTRFLQSRWCNLLLIIFAFTTSFLTERTAPLALTLNNRGLLFDSPALWFGNQSVRLWLALAMNIATLLLLVYINRRFNLLHSVNLVYAAMFMVMEAATPASLMCFSGGQLCALIMVWCMAIMFSTYNHPRRNKRIFLAFATVSAAALTQYGFVVYLPVLLLGCAQMRVFSLRTLTAAVIGLATPLWIITGLGIAPLSALHLPRLANPFSEVDFTVSVQLFATVGLTLFTGLITGSFNLLKVMSMNARARSINGLLSAIGIVTGLMTVLDFTNVEFYIPLLNACTALQIGHFIRFNASKRFYIVEILLIMAYISLWGWKLFIGG